MTISISSVHAVAQPESKPPRTSERSYPGALIVVEGVEGSGKSIQLHLLKCWLEVGGYHAHFAEWNPLPAVASVTRRAKSKRMLTPVTFSLIHAADLADRYERQILPLLRGGHIVLIDGYIYAALARDGARGCPTPWLRNLYRFAAVPDIIFYFRTPPDVAVQRSLSDRRKLRYYEAGMDLRLSLNRIESFRIFQGMIIERYEELVHTDNFIMMDGTLPVHQLQQQMRQIVSSEIDLNRFTSGETAVVLTAPKSPAKKDNWEIPAAPVPEKIATEPFPAPEIPDFVAGDGFAEHAQEINDLIARRAYELFVSRGFTHGHAREDWRRAESEVVLNVPVDIAETEAELIIRAEVPGFNHNNLQVRVVPRALCITGKRPQGSELKIGKILYSERRAFQIFRVLELPSEIDPDRVNLTLGNGMLEIKLRKARMAEVVPLLAKTAAA